MCVVWHHTGERCVIDPCLCQAKISPYSHSSCLGTLPPVCPCPWQWQMIRASQGLWGSHLGRESPWLLPVVLSICLAQSRQQRQLSYFNTLLLPTLKCAAVNGNIPANSAGRAYKELAVLFREEMQFCFRQCVSLRCVCVCVWRWEKLYPPTLSSQLAQQLLEAFSTKT